MTARPRVEFSNVSHAGLKRKHNEDSAVTDESMGLALVADGMGGYKSGEVASAIAVQVVLDGVREALQSGRKRGKGAELVDGHSPNGQLMRDSITRANKRIFNAANAIPQCQGMGTTIVAALFSAHHVTLAHVGDSRIYRYRDNVLKQMTSDHSLMQEMIDRGFYSAEEALANTPKNLVTRALGVEEMVQVDVQEQMLQAGDIFLLCSDGLNDMVKDEEISLTLGKYGANLSTAAQELVRLANQNGGKDNVTVVLARPALSAKQTGGPFTRIKSFLTGG